LSLKIKRKGCFAVLKASVNTNDKEDPMRPFMLIVPFVCSKLEIAVRSFCNCGDCS